MKTIILIPPSEGKKQGGDSPKKGSMLSVTRELVEKMLASEPNKLYGTRVEEAIELTQTLTTQNCLPVIERYTGVVYKAIDYETLENKNYFDNHVRILSALFGMLKPQENIPNYKLSITKLGSAKLWKPILTKELEDVFVIDLLPNAHRKAVEYANGMKVDFFINKNSKLVGAGHNGKWIKGRFVRWLCENKVTDPKKFEEFSEDGYKWNGISFVKRV